MTLQLNPSAPAIQRYEPPHEVVQLKPRGAVEAGALREETFSSRVAVTISHSSRASRRTSAEPTMPRWPATKTRRPARLKIG